MDKADPPKAQTAIPVIREVQSAIALPPNPLLLLLANIVSLFPILAVLLLFLTAFISANYFYLIIALGMLLVALTTELIKVVSRPFLTKYQWLARPPGAKNCGIFNTDFGPDMLYTTKTPTVDTLRPGMPSTHQAVMAFFVVAIMFYFRVSSASWLALVAASILVGWSRVYKGCHTLEQVLAGSILGIVFGTTFFNIVPN